MTRWHEKKVQERAYAIWEREGQPEGLAMQHWLQAEAEIAAEEEELKEEIRLEAAGAV